MRAQQVQPSGGAPNAGGSAGSAGGANDNGGAAPSQPADDGSDDGSDTPSSGGAPTNPDPNGEPAMDDPGAEPGNDDGPTGGLPAGQPGDPYDLGELPDGFEIVWPELPEITRDVDVDTVEEFRSAASTAGTRIHVSGMLSGGGSISASDIEVVMAEGAGMRSLTIDIKQKRVRVLGGQFSQITVSAPTVWTPSQMSDAAWTIEDVTLDGVSIDSSAIGLFPSAHRLALIRSYIHAADYSIYSDMINGSQNTDFIIAGNVFDSEGEQATLRFINLNRAVVVDNRITDLLTNGGVKHNFRVHGISDQVFFARNVLVNAGVMMASNEKDQVGEVWFNNNTFYHQTPDLFNVSSSYLTMLHAHDNTAYTKLLDPGEASKCFACRGSDAWDVGNNMQFPYQAPPPVDP